MGFKQPRVVLGLIATITEKKLGTTPMLQASVCSDWSGLGRSAEGSGDSELKLNAMTSDPSQWL